jgi:hemerythrin-like metal-binding protein
VIGAIVEHVKTHFSTEEKIMKITKFIGLYDHKKEHEAFILNVVDIITEFNRTGVINVPEVTRYLKDWVLQHIAITDRMYFDWFKKLATKKANGRFSIDEIDVMRVTQDFT